MTSLPTLASMGKKARKSYFSQLKHQLYTIQYHANGLVISTVCVVHSIQFSKQVHFCPWLENRILF